jgi:hypothetical protein
MSKNNSLDWNHLAGLAQILILVLAIIGITYSLLRPWEWLYKARFEGVMLFLVTVPLVITILKSRNYHHFIKWIIPIIAIGIVAISLAYMMPSSLIIVTHLTCLLLLIVMYGMPLVLMDHVNDCLDFKNWCMLKINKASKRDDPAAVAELTESMNQNLKWL